MLVKSEPRCWIERVVDSDTLLIWLEVTEDVRVRYRARLKGVEGGELGTEDGARGMAALAERIAELSMEATFWRGSINTRDQHGRLVGDIVAFDGSTLTGSLLKKRTHWRRNRSGQEFRS
jgi:formylmethanofuran dehydrogenase subunit C